MPDWSPAKIFGGSRAPEFYSGVRLSSHPASCSCPLHQSDPNGCSCPVHLFNASSVLTRLLDQAPAPDDCTSGAHAKGFLGWVAIASPSDLLNPTKMLQVRSPAFWHQESQAVGTVTTIKVP